MKFHIKHMVCQRCVAAVHDLLKEEGLTVVDVKLGEAEVIETPDQQQLDSLDKKLIAIGFERIDDRKSQLIDKIKTLVIENIHHRTEAIDQNWSDLIVSALPYEYKYLSKLFSSVEGITIEQFIIKQKIEKAKEQIIYDELSLSEIAYFLGYSSVPHFSSQFKKITGMNPSEFKKLQNPLRKPLDKV